jgi:hypothetical protein
MLELTLSRPSRRFVAQREMLYDFFARADHESKSFLPQYHELIEQVAPEVLR